jgi:hypothetical protein
MSPKSCELTTGDPESRYTQAEVTPAMLGIGGHVIKHSDKFTKGVPDVSWSIFGHTYWVEIKYVETREYILTRICMDRLQMVKLFQLGIHTGNRAFYLIRCESEDVSVLARLVRILPEPEIEVLHVSRLPDACLLKLLSLENQL